MPGDFSIWTLAKFDKLTRKPSSSDHHIGRREGYIYPLGYSTSPGTLPPGYQLPLDTLLPPLEETWDQGLGMTLGPEIPPPSEQNDWYTPLKALPSIAVGKKNILAEGGLNQDLPLTSDTASSPHRHCVWDFCNAKFSTGMRTFLPNIYVLLVIYQVLETLVGKFDFWFEHLKTPSHPPIWSFHGVELLDVLTRSIKVKLLSLKHYCGEICKQCDFLHCDSVDRRVFKLKFTINNQHHTLQSKDHPCS